MKTLGKALGSLLLNLCSSSLNYIKTATSQQSFSVQLVFRHNSVMSQREANAFSEHFTILRQEGKKNLSAIYISTFFLHFDAISMFHMTSSFIQGVST